MGIQISLYRHIDKSSESIQYEQGQEIIKCGILLKKARRNPFKQWKEKFVIVTVGHLIWFPVDSRGVANGVVAITDYMRKHQREMSRIYFILFNSFG